ncbi:MAG: hypothetical protein F6K15_09415 [Okeania sp. SIO2B3]|nr:hypothetical protein [Okeania sp. SIO2B3]
MVIFYLFSSGVVWQNATEFSRMTNKNSPLSAVKLFGKMPDNFVAEKISYPVYHLTKIARIN